MRSKIVRAPMTSRLCDDCGAEMVIPSVGRRSKRRFCSRQCSLRTTAKEGRLKSSRVDLVCEQCSGAFNVMGKYRARRFCSVGCRAKWQAALPYAEWRAKLSAAKENRPRGPDNPMWGRSSHHGKWCAYEGRDGPVRLRSTWELAAARFLDQLGIPWDYEPRRFLLEDRTYTPDFWLPSLGVFWEVKGWFHARHQETIRQFRRVHPELPIIVVGVGMIRGIAAGASRPARR